MPAASHAHLPVINWLEDVNARDDTFWTPLHFGAKSDACMRRLLQLGANTLHENNEGCRPLCFARAGEDAEAEAIELLEVGSSSRDRVEQRVHSASVSRSPVFFSIGNSHPCAAIHIPNSSLSLLTLSYTTSFISLSSNVRFSFCYFPSTHRRPRLQASAQPSS